MQCAVLERFELNLNLSSLWQIHGWIYETLQTITSTRFDVFTVWIPNVVYPWNLLGPLGHTGWEDVDALLSVLAELNPSFRVVVKGDFPSFHSGIGGKRGTVRWILEGLLPLVSSKGLVKFVQVPRTENRFWKLGVL